MPKAGWNCPGHLMAMRTPIAKQIVKVIRAGTTDEAHQEGAGCHVA
jgi:hypothetical protein